MKKAIIIGWWIWWLSASIFLAQAWYKVSIYEKNQALWGRASLWEKDWFVFDMGPSWYLMPDVFESFFNKVGKDINQYLQLQKLDPSYRIFFSWKNSKTYYWNQKLDFSNSESEKIVDIYWDEKKDWKTFERLEAGSEKKFKKYLDAASYQYKIALEKFVYKNYDSFLDFFKLDVAIDWAKLNVFRNMRSYVSKFFHSEYLKKIVSYPLLFLWTSPYNAIAIYSIMSHVDFRQWVFYPKWGLYQIIRALEKIAKKNWVEIFLNQNVEKIVVEKWVAVWIISNWKNIECDIVISNADMAFSEMNLLEQKYQTFNKKYWDKKVLAPSSFILYLWVDKKLNNLTHHNLIFTQDWKKNFWQIFKNPMLPDQPSLYICKPSETDKQVAPKGKENLFVLVPVAPWLELDETQKQKYAKKILKDIENSIGEKFADKILFQRIYEIKDFQKDYNAFRWTALWLAHTLSQSALWRPNNYSKKVKNLFYTGAYTNPWIWTQMALISWELTAKRVLQKTSYGR